MLTIDLTKERRKEVERLLSAFDDAAIVGFMRESTQLNRARTLMASGFAELEQKQAQGLGSVEARRIEFRIAAEVMIMLGVDPLIGEIGKR